MIYECFKTLEMQLRLVAYFFRRIGPVSPRDFSHCSNVWGAFSGGGANAHLLRCEYKYIVGRFENLEMRFKLQHNLHMCVFVLLERFEEKYRAILHSLLPLEICLNCACAQKGFWMNRFPPNQI